MEKIEWIEECLRHALEVAWLEGHEPALKLLDRILYEEPGYSRLHHTIGVIYLQYAEDTKMAEGHFRMAIRFDPEFADPYWYLGELLRQEDRLDDAIDVYLKGIEARRARKSDLLAGAGQAYELKKKYRKAIRHYKKALDHSAVSSDCRALEQSIIRCRRKRKGKVREN